MAKKLNLVFTTAAGGDYTLGLSGPKEDLTLADAQSAAEKLIPVITTSAGVELSALKKATLVTTTEEDLA